MSKKHHRASKHIIPTIKYESATFLLQIGLPWKDYLPGIIFFNIYYCGYFKIENILHGCSGEMSSSSTTYAKPRPSPAIVAKELILIAKLQMISAIRKYKLSSEQFNIDQKLYLAWTKALGQLLVDSTWKSITF